MSEPTISPATAAYSRELASQQKDRMDRGVMSFATHVVQTTMIEMFNAGYIRALVEHGLIKGDSIPEQPKKTSEPV